MVETKFSVLDSQEDTSLVRADHLHSQNDALLAEHVTPVTESPTHTIVAPMMAPPGSTSANHGCESNPIPTILTEEEEQNRDRIVGAGIASGIFGFLVGGPIIAMLFGFTAAYVAENKTGVVGDTARAVGDIALSTKAKAKEIDEKHHVAEKTKQAAADAWQKAKEIDREHHVLEKTREVLVNSWVATSDFVRRHNLVERSMNAVGRWVCWAIEKLIPEQQPQPDRENQSSKK